MNYIDLHIHSSYSDGTLTPSLLVQQAKKIGLRAISLTDHDTTEGVEEIISYGNTYGVEILSGVELSAHIDASSVHILGYGLQYNDPALLARLVNIQEARDTRNKKIINRLNELGIKITKEDVYKFSKTGQTGRPHFAQFLIEKKLVNSFDGAFDIYLGQNGSAYVPRKILLAADAIRYILDAGGLPVLAHPATIDCTMSSIPDLLETLKNFGLSGVEVYYPTHSKKVRKTLLELTRKYDLIATGGSDFHGHRSAEKTLGRTGKNQRLPYEVLENIKTRLSAKKTATIQED